jgi:glucose/arabinose dehydrogenase
MTRKRNGFRTLEPLESRVLFAVPSGFAQSTTGTGLTRPTSLEFAPDGTGRIFVTEQAGSLRVIGADGQLRSTPFATVPTLDGDERGLLGVTFDPAFTANRYVYVYWTQTNPGQIRNTVTRFTASASDPNVAEAGSRVDLFILPNNGGSNHQGGAIHFGPDGKLYVAVGEHGNPSDAQSLATPFGKLLRINSDGTIPTDNPFYDTATGQARAIWAYGLRNPFTFAFEPGTGRAMVNDVGAGDWEEINELERGANYGWPTTEGAFNPTTHPSFTNPMGAYGSDGCAITGGVFYHAPAGASRPWPSAYEGDYFFADYCRTYVKRVNPDAGGGTLPGGAQNLDSLPYFATELTARPVDVDVSPEGDLYVLCRGTESSGSGLLTRVTYTASDAPSINQQPQSRTVTAGQSATFTVTASGAGPLGYQWQRNGTNIPGATSASYTLGSTQASDNGATFRCVVTNSHGSATSNAATLTVTANQAPTGSITVTAPAGGGLYTAGQPISFSGTATDPEQGTLGASTFTWRVDFHHDEHTHPALAPTSGSTTGTYNVPTTGETSANVWYRVHLTVTDSGGLTHSTFADVHPRTAQVTVATSHAGLSLDLDGQPRTAPHSFTGVAGVVRTLSAPATQVVGDVTYEFVSWSDAGARQHTVPTPAANTTYTATYRVVDTSPPAVTSQPQDRGVNEGQPASFTVTASGAAPLSYQWQRNGTNVPGATAATYTLPSAQASDDGATFRCVVTNPFGTATSNAATLTVATGQPPVGTINAPAGGALFRGGETISYSGSATDAEDGPLGAAAFSWEVVLHRGGLAVTVVAPTDGATGGSFTVPASADVTAGDVYRIHLRVTDSDGLTHELTRDVAARTASVTLATTVPGLQLALDGAPVAAPHTFIGVAGTTHAVNAPPSQTVGGVTYDFASWSDGGAALHDVQVTDAGGTYTAVYEAQSVPDAPYDLAPALASATPPEVIGGKRGVASVRVTNNGTDLLTGLVTVRVFMSSDPILDPSDAQAGTVTRPMRLRPAASRPVKLRLTYPDIPDGNYYLLAAVDPDNTVGEGNEANNVTASAETIFNHAPVIDFSGAMPVTPATLMRGRRGAVAVTVLNGGNVVAAGPLTLRLYAADGNSPPTNLAQLLEVVRPVKIRPGGRKVVKVAFVPPADLPAGTYYFTAEIDPVAAHEETNEANNLAVSAGSFTIA